MTERSGRSEVLFWASWHALSILAILGLIGYRLGMRPWRFPEAVRVPAAVFVVGYCLGAGLLHLRRRGGRTLTFVEVVALTLAGFALPFLYFIVADLQLSRFAIILATAAGLGSLVIGFSVRRFRALLLGGLGLATLGILGKTGSAAAVPGRPKARSVASLSTSLYDVRATYYRNYLPRSISHLTGGGIASFGGNHLVVTSDGTMFGVAWDSTGAPVVTRLQGSVPLNREEFAKVAGTGAYVGWFRALDVLVHDNGNRRQVFVSHHRWRPDEKCFVVRVSMVEGALEAGFLEIIRGEWRTVHETTPCLPLVMREPGWPFRGMEGGGRMVMLEEGLLLTVGDQGYNGVDFESEPDYVQDSTTSYGKTVLVDLSSGTWRPFTIGHRNAQGLAIDSTGHVWLTEHGPQGGDELNRLERGANYGWPKVTYGTEYGRHVWPPNPHQGQHKAFRGPYFTWVPSIGASSLIQVRGTSFDSWRGDLLVGTLVGESILRIRMADDHVVLVEPIPLQERVRDLVEDARGRIVVLTDSYSLIALEPAKETLGTCAGCHTLGGAAPGRRLGPDLAGIVGRPVAGDSSFAYSTALKALGGSWDEDRLDRFLADPAGMAPGTSMAMEGIRDARMRRAIIDYLKAN